MSDSSPYSVPKEPGRWRAIGLALVMHAALLAFLWIGIRWQNQTPEVIEAEVWSMQPKEAAPKPQPEPEIKPEPTPEPKPQPKPEPKPEVKETPMKKPDIALEQEKKRKAQEEKRREEEELKRAKLKEKQEKERLAKLEEEKRVEKKRAEEEKKKREQAAKDKKLADLAEQLRKEDLKRMMAGTGGSGNASKTQGIRGDANYAAKIRQRIRSNTAFIVPADLQGNPAVEYEVKLFPDGSLRGAPRKIKSSGIPAFDDAVLRAIDLSQPFPADKSGAVPSTFIVAHQPKDN